MQHISGKNHTMQPETLASKHCKSLWRGTASREIRHIAFWGFLGKQLPARESATFGWENGCFCGGTVRLHHNCAQRHFRLYTSGCSLAASGIDQRWMQEMVLGYLIHISCSFSYSFSIAELDKFWQGRVGNFTSGITRVWISPWRRSACHPHVTWGRGNTPGVGCIKASLPLLVYWLKLLKE